MTLTEYLAKRRMTIGGTIAVEMLAGNEFKVSCERAALAEITVLEIAVGRGEIQRVSTLKGDSNA